MPKINVNISTENLLYLNSLAEASGKSRYSILSAFAEAAIDAARKNESFKSGAEKNSPTMGERLRRIENHAKFNSSLLGLMLQRLTPDQAATYKDLKKKYIE